MEISFDEWQIASVLAQPEAVFALWLIANAHCSTRADFLVQFEDDVTIIAIIDDLLRQGFLTEDDGKLALTDAGNTVITRLNRAERVEDALAVQGVGTVVQDSTARDEQRQHIPTQSNVPILSSGTTVLIVDPDQAQQRVISQALSPRYRVISAYSLAEAVQLLAQYQPRFLLIEIEQPDGDGLTLVRQLRLDPQTRSMIIVCVTRRASIRDKISGFQAGADDYIEKPINIQTFAARLVLLARLRQT